MKTNHYLDRQLSEIMEKAFFFLIDKKHAEISNTECWQMVPQFSPRLLNKAMHVNCAVWQLCIGIQRIHCQTSCF